MTNSYLGNAGIAILEFRQLRYVLAGCVSREFCVYRTCCELEDAGASDEEMLSSVAKLWDAMFWCDVVWVDGWKSKTRCGLTYLRDPSHLR